MCSGADAVAGVANAAALERELAWFDEVLQARISLHFEQPCAFASVEQIAPPVLERGSSEYAQLVHEFGLGFRERLLLVLALVPHLRPQALDMLFLRNRNLDRGFTEFGGWKGRTHGGFLPTCETAAFLVAGTDLAKRFAAFAMFDAAHPLIARGVLRVEHDAPGEPPLAGGLSTPPEYLRRLTTGAWHKPDYDSSFPAKLVTTPLVWSDLVVGRPVLDELASIRTWAAHAATLLGEWRLAKSIKPG